MGTHISARRVVLTSFFVDLLDIIINVSIAVLTGSVVMLAELFEAIADLISSAFLLVALKHKKQRVFWTFASAIMMLCFASTASFYFGFRRFLHPEVVHNIFLAYGALIVGAISNGYAFSVSVKRILEKSPFPGVIGLIKTFRSSNLIMTKNTFVLDLMGASAAITGLVALILYRTTGVMRFDGLGAMGVGIVLAVLSLDLLINMRAAAKS